MQKINRNLMLKDEMGRSLPAIDVFAMSIRFLKDDVLENCNKGRAGIKIVTQDVQWVLTVPAIWNDGAKQFMRESALKVRTCILRKFTIYFNQTFILQNDSVLIFL
jgi:hypothetical protein